MSSTVPRQRQILDARAALLAGLVAGLAFFALLCALTAITVGSPWVFPRLVAAVVLGKSVLPPPATFDAGVVLVALVVHLPISIGLAALIAFVIHRGGTWTGILGGALLGLALYAIAFALVRTFAPWVTMLDGWIAIVAHVAFGAIAGGVYEAFEIERFVPIEERP
jgi:hypothetical protein